MSNQTRKYDNANKSTISTEGLIDHQFLDGQQDWFKCSLRISKKGYCQPSPHHHPRPHLFINHIDTGSCSRQPHLQLRLCSALRQLLHDFALQLLWLLRARPSIDDLSISANQELLEVPLDTFQAHEAGLLLLEPLEQRIRVVTVDFGLAHDRERHTVVDLAKRLDVGVRAWFLPAELVAWEAEDREVFAVGGLELLVQLLQTVILRGEAALGGSVDNKNDFALVI